MYITSFIHRDELFEIAERWLCGRLQPDDGLRITQILTTDGYVLGYTLENLMRELLGLVGYQQYREFPIRFKGEIRNILARNAQGTDNHRVNELVNHYINNPEYFYLEAPINGAMCLSQDDKCLGLYRAKRPRRIAEKANRYVANWIFKMVQNRAREMAKERAQRFGIPLEWLVTPQHEMEMEFIASEKAIAQRFKDGTIHLDKSTLTINDVGGIKLIADTEQILQIERELVQNPKFKVLQKERFVGNYRATSFIVEIPWDREGAIKSFLERKGWKKYLGRGIHEEQLMQGLEPMLTGASDSLCVELIFSTFPDVMESEIGKSIHEERIIEQRKNEIYKGYIPMNVEFIFGYLFAVGMSSHVNIDRLPIKLWGRYLPDTYISHIGELYAYSEKEFLI